MSIFSKKNTALHGVDISSSSIKLIELSKSGSKFKVENYANRPVPENAAVEKNINDLEAVGDVVIKMASVLKTMFFGDLPYIGGLFRRTENTETKTELLIFITPSILNDV